MPQPHPCASHMQVREWIQHQGLPEPIPAMCPKQMLPQLRTTIQHRRGPGRPEVKFSTYTAGGSSVGPSRPDCPPTCHPGIQEKRGNKEEGDTESPYYGETTQVKAQGAGAVPGQPLPDCPGAPDHCPCQLPTSPTRTSPHLAHAAQTPGRLHLKDFTCNPVSLSAPLLPCVLRVTSVSAH